MQYMVGFDGVVKVADFGLAKVSQDERAQGLTQGNVVMGTLHYMAPEALILSAAVDHRADIYAVGVMLYQMLTGKVPHGIFELPSAQVKGLDPRYDAIIAKAMREDCKARYQSADDLRRDLDAIVTQPMARVVADEEKAPPALPTQARPARPSGQPFRASPPTIIVRERSSVPLIFWAALLVTGAAAAWLLIGRLQPQAGGEETPAAVSQPVLTAPPAPQASIAAPPTAPPMTERAPAPKTEFAPPRLVASASTTTVKGLGPAASGSPAVPPADGLIAWTDNQGRLVRAAFKGITGDNVLLEVPGSDPAPFPLAKLSAGSQTLARELESKRSQAVAPAAASQVPKPDPALARIAASARAYPLDGMPESAKDRVRRAVSIVKVVDPRVKRVLRLTAAQEDWIERRDVKLQADCAEARAREAATGRRSNEVMDLHCEALRDVLAQLTMEQLLTWEEILGPGAAHMEGYTGGPILEELKRSWLSGLPPALSSSGTALAALSLPAAGSPASSTSRTQRASSLNAATKNLPFLNSLGMAFIPLPGTKVLMCSHETRYRDYAPFASDSPSAAGSLWRNQTDDGFRVTDRAEDHPVSGVSWGQAKSFCEWLGRKEDLKYRLPDHEERDAATGKGRFPWGSEWPPPARSGNFSDAARQRQAPRFGTSYIPGYDDGFPTTAPVMSYPANSLGFHDLGGNVWEWCGDDAKRASSALPALRGGSWTTAERERLQRSFHADVTPGNPTYGFRVVIERP